MTISSISTNSDDGIQHQKKKEKKKTLMTTQTPSKVSPLN